VRDDLPPPRAAARVAGTLFTDLHPASRPDMSLVRIELEVRDDLPRLATRTIAGRRHDQAVEILEQPSLARAVDAPGTPVEPAPAASPTEPVVEPSRFGARQNGIGL
jgi:hypothetical protein